MFEKLFYWKSKKKPQTFRDLHALPVFNWFELHKTGDLIHLSKSGKPGGAELTSAYYAIWNHYFKEFGQTEDYKLFLGKLRSMARKMAKYLKTGNRRELTFINISKQELIGGKKDEVNFRAQWAFVLKTVGFRADQKEMSTYDYLTLIQDGQS